MFSLKKFVNDRPKLQKPITIEVETSTYRTTAYSSIYDVKIGDVVLVDGYYSGKLLKVVSLSSSYTGYLYDVIGAYEPEYFSISGIDYTAIKGKGNALCIMEAKVNQNRENFEVFIPEEYDGKRIAHIDKNAFNRCFRKGVDVRVYYKHDLSFLSCLKIKTLYLGKGLDRKSLDLAVLKECKHIVDEDDSIISKNGCIIDRFTNSLLSSTKGFDFDEVYTAVAPDAFTGKINTVCLDLEKTKFDEKAFSAITNINNLYVKNCEYNLIKKLFDNKKILGINYGSKYEFEKFPGCFKQIYNGYYKDKKLVVDTEEDKKKLKQLFKLATYSELSEIVNDYEMIKTIIENDFVDLSILKELSDKCSVEVKALIASKQEPLSSFNFDTDSNTLFEFSKNFEYELLSSGINVNKYIGDDNVAIIIPDKIKNIPIRTISDNCFNGYSKVRVTLKGEFEQLKKTWFYLPLPKPTLDLSDVPLSDGRFSLGLDMELGNIIMPKALKILAHSRKEMHVAEIVLPNSLERIESGAFNNIDTNKVIFPNKPVVLEERAFCHSRIKCLDLNNAVEHVPNNCFMENYFMEEILHTDSVKTFGEGVFQYSKIKKFYFPNLEELPSNTFDRCSVENVYLSKAIKSIKDDAFGYSKIGSFEIEPGFIFENTSSSVYVSDGKNLYWSISGIMPDSIENINCHFDYNQPLRDFVMPSHIQNIGSSVFESVTFEKDVTLPSTLKSLGSECFKSTTIPNLNIECDPSLINNFTFHGAKIRKINLKATSNSLDLSFLAQISDIKTINISKSIKKIIAKSSLRKFTKTKLVLESNKTIVGDSVINCFDIVSKNSGDNNYYFYKFENMSKPITKESNEIILKHKQASNLNSNDYLIVSLLKMMDDIPLPKGISDISISYVDEYELNVLCKNSSNNQMYATVKFDAEKLKLSFNCLDIDYIAVLTYVAKNKRIEKCD